MSERPRFFHFSYLGPYTDETPRIHEIRDGDAFVELSAALYSEGYEYGNLILNYPNPDYDFDLSELKPTDLLVLTTRPPLKDTVLDRRAIKKSGTQLETKILNTLGKYFEKCTREKVIIQQEFAEHLALRNRSEIWFHVSQDKRHGLQRSRYIRYRDRYATTVQNAHWHYPEILNTTAAYMVLTQIENGPMLLNAFGMGGQITLIWCHLLRTVLRQEHPDLLKLPRFIIAEIETDLKPQKPATLLFTKDFKVNLLLNHTWSETDG